MPKINNVILIALTLMVIAVIFPIALGLIAGAGDTLIDVNGTPTALSELADPAVITLLTILLPIIAVIGIVMYFIPRGGGD